MTISFFWGMTPCSVEIFTLMCCVASRKAPPIRDVALETSHLTEFLVSELPGRHSEIHSCTSRTHNSHSTLRLILTPQDSKLNKFQYTSTLEKNIASRTKFKGKIQYLKNVNTCSVHLLLFCTMTKKCTVISQIVTLLHVSTLSCYLQGPCNQYLAKLHKYFKCSCW